jgi:hypothetical protein
VSDDSDPYSNYPDHPLRDIDPKVLDVARAVMKGGVVWKDVDPDAADPLADSVVAALAQAGYLGPSAWLSVD